MIARSLDLRPGDEVLTSDHEYGAADLMWDLVCRRAGATYVRLPVSVPVRSTEEVVDAVWGGVTERTRVLFVSHVSSPTALVFPIHELCRRAREAGVLAVVDGAHGPGHVPLDLAVLEADAYAGNCHKWLCTPKGAGFLWVRPELHGTVDSLVLGWGWSEEDASFVARNEEQGTRDPAAYLAVPAALDFIERRGWDDVRVRCHELAAEVRRRLAELTGIAPLQPDSAEWFGQMVAAALPDCDAGEVSRRLAHEHRVEVYGKAWNGRPVIRVSVQGYTSAGRGRAPVRSAAEGARRQRPRIAAMTVTAAELISVNPATLEEAGRVSVTPPEEVVNVVAAAAFVQANWSRERAPALLARVAQSLLDHADELASTITAETGRPLIEAYTIDVFTALENLVWLSRQAPGLLRDEQVPVPFWLLHKRPRIVYEPLGVIGVIGPWNVPLAIPLSQAAAAVLAGNAVVVKPSERTPLTGAWIERLFVDAGGPEGLVRVVQGGPSAGDALVRAPGVGRIVLTGSATTGRAVAGAAAERLRPTTLELGGKDPMVVFADADLERAVAGGVWGAFANCGQLCSGVERI